jgi:hypothetical protein
MVDVDPGAIARSLYLRRASGVLVPFETRAIAWKPHPRFCHINADKYALQNLDHEPVRGWLIFDYSDIGRFRFMSHSVVADKDGKLFDITPAPATRPPFLRHEGPEGEFEAIVGAGHLWLDYSIGHEK